MGGRGGQVVKMTAIVGDVLVWKSTLVNACRGVFTYTVGVDMMGLREDCGKWVCTVQMRVTETLQLSAPVYLT
jgi:hypothetical protein